MTFTDPPILSNSDPAVDRNTQFRESLPQISEQRGQKRIDVLRPVLYLCRDSDEFIDGTILNWSRSGICVQSAFPVEPLTQIFITTRIAVSAPITYKTGESGFAIAVWCERKAGAYRIGIRFDGGPLHVNWEAAAQALISPQELNM